MPMKTKNEIIGWWYTSKNHSIFIFRTYLKKKDKYDYFQLDQKREQNHLKN